MQWAKNYRTQFSHRKGQNFKEGCPDYVAPTIGAPLPRNYLSRCKRLQVQMPLGSCAGPETGSPDRSRILALEEVQRE